MKSKSVLDFPKVPAKVLRHTLACLFSLTLIVRCARGAALLSDYIVSPHTAQTINFFSRSQSDSHPNVLDAVQVLGETHLTRTQTQQIHVDLTQYTLESVPEKLVHEIEFAALVIESSQAAPSTARNTSPDTPAHAIFSKILRAFGTISADVLQLSNVVLDVPEADPNTQNTLEDPNPAQTPTCVLKIKSLKIFDVEEPAIRWLQKQVNLSKSRICLEVSCPLVLENLKLLDGFNAAAVVELKLYGLLWVLKLECQLLLNDSLPDVLIIESPHTLTLNASTEIASKILEKHWKTLSLPMHLWGKLMGPDNQYKHIAVDDLRVYLPALGYSLGVLPTPLFPSLGDNTATCNSLKIDFRNERASIAPSGLLQTLDWISRHFRGLEELDVEFGAIQPQLKAFVQTNQFLITTNPTLKNVRLVRVDCLEQHQEKRTILCFSLDAWDQCIKGNLAAELTPAELEICSPDEQMMILNPSTIDVDDADEFRKESTCLICYETFDNLEETNPNTEICLLDHPKHRMCNTCLDRVMGEAGKVSCPMCREDFNLSNLKNRIERNSQGGFGIVRVPFVRVGGFFFPNNNLEEFLRAI
ncbi:hypothetical protein NEDG_01248 [Nematocida displodere]|uniref:RING-type domain-containing protein n=1 Tax=Nematocida displodere TaxID=1805483 RepID=A0A177EDN9_9MICR|nr:hypothetical protein NEDG_01248 [Nematocida displodere]